jgi:hypothetical protein
MIQSLPRPAGCYATTTQFLPERARPAAASEHQRVSLIGLDKRGRLRVDQPTITGQLAHLRTHTAHHSPVMIAPLSINSSHADCRPERSFFSKAPRRACGCSRAALRAPLVFARRATPHLSSLAGIAKMPKDKGAAQSKATRSSGTTTLRSKAGGVRMGLSLACGWWPILADVRGSTRKAPAVPPRGLFVFSDLAYLGPSCCRVRVPSRPDLSHRVCRLKPTSHPRGCCSCMKSTTMASGSSLARTASA